MKAAVASPRRAMGNILGHAIRFGAARGHHGRRRGHRDRAVCCARPLPAIADLIAATSSAHLAAIQFPPELRRLYVARDRKIQGGRWLRWDDALGPGTGSRESNCCSLMPELGDFNDDLRQHGAPALSERVIAQLHEADRSRFIES
jgi:hypothetical protein